AGGDGQGLGHGEIAGEPGGDLEGVETLLQGVGALHDLQGNFGGAVEGLFDERSTLGFGTLVGEHHGVESFGVSVHGRGEEGAVVFEGIAGNFGEARDHGTEGGGHGCGCCRGAAAARGGGGGGQRGGELGQAPAAAAD